MTEMNKTYNFDPNEHLVQLKSKAGSQDYLPVQFRLVWINADVERAVAEGKEVELEIDSEEVEGDPDKEFEAEAFVWNAEKRRSEKVIKSAKGYAKYKATVRLRIGSMVKKATAYKMEKAVDFPDYIEKANTGAVGRALGMIGYGTQYAPEFNEGNRLADAPVDSGGNRDNGMSRPSQSANQGNNTPPENENEANATEQQISSIRKLCTHLGKSEPENLTRLSFGAAKKAIQSLTAEYKEKQQSSRAS